MPSAFKAVAECLKRMTHYHIVHFIPTERHHGLYGYNEVIQTISWGLTALGHTVTYAKNKLGEEGSTNIVFGCQMVGWDILKMLPKGTIVYNLEQYRSHAYTDYGKEVFEFLVKNFEIWDYSDDNMLVWTKRGPEFPVSKVPIGYAPVLTRIPKPQDQDIDVLIYGSPSANRIKAFQDLCGLGLRVMFLYGFYGEARDELIARSKIVLNIGQYDRTFEIVRVSYLMANSKAVVADLYPDITIERDIVDGVLFIGLEHLAAACLHLVENDEARMALEQRAFQVIKNRDIVAILHATLNGQMVVG